MNTFLDETSRKRRYLIVAAAAVGVVLVVALVVWALTRSTTGTPNASPSGSPPPAASGAVQLPTGALKLIKGERTVEGISVGYPHTMPGAVSAAAEYLTQVLSNLDEQRARQIATVIADPSFADAQDYMGKGPANLRKTLGLPTTGPVPSGASLTFGPAAYQLRDATPDTVTVLILAYLTSTTPDGQIKSTVGAYPAELHWDGTDWKVLKPGAATAADYTGLVAQPGTAEAAAKGWQELTP